MLNRHKGIWSEIARFGLLQILLACAPICSRATDGLFHVLNPNNAPTRLAKGLNNTIYVTDHEVSSVFIYDANLVVTGELKGFNAPLGIAVTPDGRIFIGSDGDDLIHIVNPDGSPSGTIGEGLLLKPNDLCLDLSNNLYVADSQNNRVTVFDRFGNLVRHIGTTGTNDGEFTFPIAVTVGSRTNASGAIESELFVADQGNYRVQVFDLDGNFLRKFGSMVTGSFSYTWKGRFLTLQDIEIDDLYRVVTLDSYPSDGPATSNAVQILDAQSGAYIISFGYFGTGPGQVNLPLSLMIQDQKGMSNNVVIANHDNQMNEVLFSLPAAGITTLATNAPGDNVASGTLIGSLSVSPAPGTAPGFMLVPGAGGADNDLFSVVGSNLFADADLNYEDQPIHYVRIKALYDGSTNLAFATQFEIRLGDLNDPPASVSLDDSEIAEALSAGTLVGSLQASDEDPADTHTFALVAGAGDANNNLFSISGSNLLSAIVFDADVHSNLSIRVAASDNGGLSGTSVLAVTVIPVNALGEEDRDRDGMPDWWEYDNTGSNTDFDQNGDEDADGVSNFEEWFSATDPINSGNVSNDMFIVDMFDRSENGAPIIRWPSGAQRAYDVEFTDNLEQEFTPLDWNLPAAPPMNVYTDAANTGITTLFYRIKVKLAP